MGKAMENCGLREGSDQEEWGKLGPLAEPTPSNAKNKGAADRRRRRREHGRDTGTSEGGDNAHEGHEENDSQGRGEGSDESETEEVRRAMSETIWEMEREDEETDEAAATKYYEDIRTERIRLRRRYLERNGRYTTMT